MARINVEQKALTDARYAVLAKLLGLADAHHARGYMLLVWNECQEREAYVLPGVVINALLQHENAASYLVISELAQNKGNGSYRIRGTRGRIEWLANCRKRGRSGGQKGGRPRKPLGVIGTETPGGLAQKTPPAPAPAPAEESEQELCAVDTAPLALTATRSNGLPDGFPEWWAAYRDGLAPRPMRDKAQCADLWRKERFTTQQAKALLGKLTDQIEYRRNHASDRNVLIPSLPDPIRYLKRRLWHEELPDA